MSTISFNGIIGSSYPYQGDYNSNGSFSRKKLQMSFDTSSFKEKAKNIRINSAILTVTCSQSGGEWKKTFTFKSGLTGSFTTNKNAFGQACDLDITNGSNILAYLQNGGGQITSADESSSSLNRPKYTYYYVRLTAAKLTIDYSELSSKLTSVPSKITLGETGFSYTLEASSSTYTHDLQLAINGASVGTIDTGISGSGTKSYTKGNKVSWASNFTTPSTSAQLILITKDSSGQEIGRVSYSTTVYSANITGLKPSVSISNITTTDSYTLGGKTWVKSGTSKITVKLSGSGVYNSTISSYSLSVNGTNISGSNGSYTFTAFGSGKMTFSASVVDSRGSTQTDSSQVRYITNYTSPYIIVGGNPVYRTREGAGTSTGDCFEFTYTSATASKIIAFEGGAELSNSYTITLTLDGTSYTVNQSTKKWSSKPTTYESDISKNIIVSIKDSTGISMSTTSYDFYAPSVSYLLHFLNQKNSVAMGCAAESPSSGEAGRITMGWPAYMKNNATIEGNLVVNGTLSLTKDNPLSIDFGGTGAFDAAGARKNLEIDGIVSTINTNIGNNTINIGTNTTNIGKVSDRVGTLERYAHIKHIETGTFGGTDVSPNSYVDVETNFSKAFTNTPFVICCFETDSTAGYFGRCTVSVYPKTDKHAGTDATHVVLRIFNGDNTGRKPRVKWLAIEL